MLQKKNFYINGKWIVPKNQKDIQVIDPATEKSCAVISLGGKEDVNAAVLAAKDAFVYWGFTSKEVRIKLLEKLYEIYKKRWNDISDAITNLSNRWILEPAVCVFTSVVKDTSLFVDVVQL